MIPCPSLFAHPCRENSGRGVSPSVRKIGNVVRAYRGRRKALSIEQAADLKSRVAAGQPKTQVDLDFAISRETLYQYLRADDSQ
ncbi:MAG: Hin recombinase [Chlorobiaceae bacterium]|nr:Hin recombinase [Chlorobiaceae bacterium]